MYTTILTTPTALSITYLYQATNATHTDHHLLISCSPSNLDINRVQFPFLSNSLLTRKSHLIWATHSSCDQSYQIFPWNSYCVWILDSFLKHGIDLHHAKSKSVLSSLNVGTTWPKTFQSFNVLTKNCCSTWTWDFVCRTEEGIGEDFK